jgi:chromate reductase
LTAPAQRIPRVLGISGGIRRESNNTAVLRTLKDKLAGEVELSIFPLNDIPLYNADLDNESLPKSVQAPKDAINESDDLLQEAGFKRG